MEDFIEGFRNYRHKLAVAIGVPRRINKLFMGSRNHSGHRKIRVSPRYFGTTPGFLDESAKCDTGLIALKECAGRY